MSHPPTFSLTPADLATEAGGRGSRVDELSVLRLGGTWRGLEIVWSLRPQLNCRRWGRLHLRHREFTWGEDASPSWRRQEASVKVEGHLGGDGLLTGGAEALFMPRGSYLHRGALPETLGLTWGAGTRGGRREGEGGSARRGSAGRRATLTLRASPRLGARGSSPPGWPGLRVGGAPGGRRPPPTPARVRSLRDLFTPRPAAAAAAAGGGGGQPLVPAAAVANRRAVCK